MLRAPAGRGGAMALGDALLLGLAALVPVALLSLTSFVKISVVLSLLRGALGTPDAPSSLVVLGLSLMLSAVAMAPVVTEMAAAAFAPTDPGASGAASPASGRAGPPGTSVGDPGRKGRVEAPAAEPAPSSWRAVVPASRHREVEAAIAAAQPLRRFLSRQASAEDRLAFASLARSLGRPAEDDSLAVLAPAFISSELKRAFVMALVLLLPFLVIDLVVGLTLTALGASSMSPQTVALPLKLLLFLAVDGWRLLIESLLRGYA
ncbi:MAG: flagellar type III secretion system pore protein FliP [Kofleriaceae bacterium]